MFSAGRGGVRETARSVYGTDEAKRRLLQATTCRNIRLRARYSRRFITTVNDSDIELPINFLLLHTMYSLGWKQREYRGSCSQTAVMKTDFTMIIAYHRNDDKLCGYTIRIKDGDIKNKVQQSHTLLRLLIPSFEFQNLK